MKTGTVKFFNESKSFGRAAGGGATVSTVKLIVPIAMDKGLR